MQLLPDGANCQNMENCPTFCIMRHYPSWHNITAGSCTTMRATENTWQGVRFVGVTKKAASILVRWLNLFSNSWKTNSTGGRYENNLNWYFTGRQWWSSSLQTFRQKVLLMRCCQLGSRMCQTEDARGLHRSGLLFRMDQINSLQCQRSCLKLAFLQQKC